MSDIFRRTLEESWRDLLAAPVSADHRLRTARLPVTTSRGPVLAAVDREGHRHLMVPIAGNQHVREIRDGQVLHLRKRPLEDKDVYQHYADLRCLRRDLDDVFTRLCEDVLREMAQLGEDEQSPATPRPLKVLHRVLDRWRSLFRTSGRPLGPEQLAGLYGELHLLLRLLAENPSAHRMWTGPTGRPHDFTSGTEAVEVKTATGDALRIRVHGLRQLEPPEGGSLQLACLRVERVPEGGNGASVVDLVEQALRLSDDESALLGLLAEVGYHTVDAERYRTIRFLVRDERWYAVGAGFPRITTADLAVAEVPGNVTDVEYTVDLTVPTPDPLPMTEVERHLAAMLREKK
ncbi:PD-(D/E)XK motif protein [Streptomyces sp. WAC 01529]|uniref:PD-(D/E)XK motif protein n=1 Tax=Streptomyces sp. WAC 01529 TaxID=2203205 RepID=UPI0013E01DF9|nr:PD-(D/E)XK motif protein [Streptomyces sp. WAC 01529]